MPEKPSFYFTLFKSFKSSTTGLVEALDERLSRIVDGQLFCPVQLHASALRIKKHRTSGVTWSSRSSFRPASRATRSHSSLG
jgi:hypothetical protein